MFWRGHHDIVRIFVIEHAAIVGMRFFNANLVLAFVGPLFPTISYRNGKKIVRFLGLLITPKCAFPITPPPMTDTPIRSFAPTIRA
jgi:hypothetical protein